jgi:hypothetical protein
VAAATVAAILAGAAVGAWQESQPKLYGASAQMVVQPAPETLAVAGARPDNLVFLARTYAAHFGTHPTMQSALRRAGLDISVNKGLARTAVSVSNSDATISITTTGRTKADARALNEALTQVVIDEVNTEQNDLRAQRLAPLDQQITEVQSQLGSSGAGSPERASAQQTYQTLVATRAQLLTQPSDRLAVLSPAQAASGPVSPHPARNGVLAFLVVAALAAQLIVWRATRRRRTPPAPGAGARDAQRSPANPTGVDVAPVLAPAYSTAEPAPAGESAVVRMARRAPTATRTPAATHAPGGATRKPRTATRRPPKPRTASVDGAEMTEGT